MKYAAGSSRSTVLSSHSQLLASTARGLSLFAQIKWGRHFLSGFKKKREVINKKRLRRREREVAEHEVRVWVGGSAGWAGLVRWTCGLGYLG